MLMRQSTVFEKRIKIADEYLICVVKSFLNLAGKKDLTPSIDIKKCT